MDLPGVRKEDIDVAVSHGNLVIRGGRAVEALAEDERHAWTKRDIGRFYRRIILPPGVAALEMAIIGKSRARWTSAPGGK